jgi:hypothetical protein
MFKKHCKFWECVQNKEPPELCDRDYVEKTDDFWLEVEKQWKIAKRDLKVLEQTEKQLRDTLISMSSNSNCRGKQIQLTKCVRKGRIVYESMPQLKDVDFEIYREPPTEYWKIGDVK